MANQSKIVLTGQARKLPMMPIRDMVIFPHMIDSVCGWDGCRACARLEEALKRDAEDLSGDPARRLGDEPSVDDIYETGTIGNIVQSVRMPDGNIKGTGGGRGAGAVDRRWKRRRRNFLLRLCRTGKTQLEMTPQVEQMMQRRSRALFEQLC